MNVLSFSGIKSTVDETMRFFWGNELKLTEVEMLLFFYFKSVHVLLNLYLIFTVPFTSEHISRRENITIMEKSDYEILL